MCVCVCGHVQKGNHGTCDSTWCAHQPILAIVFAKARRAEDNARVWGKDGAARGEQDRRRRRRRKDIRAKEKEINKIG